MNKPFTSSLTDEVERLVQNRTAELSRANETLRWELRKSRQETAQVVQLLSEATAGSKLERESRRAALNLMEDAVQAREAEQRENEERRRVESELREANWRKDEFLATLAHELRNPLAPIQNSLHILRMAGADAGGMERILGMLERQVRHLVRLVDDLLEVARINHGKFELHKEHVELASVMRTAVETSKPLIDAARVQFAIALPAEPVILLVDPIRIAQAISNLLNNAAKYTEPGGQIWLSARVDDAHAVLVVRDTGTGIAPEMLAKVFDLFTQVDRTLGRAGGGLGIGLSLVRNLVEMHGGRIEARSDGPGQGSEFEIRLPIGIAPGNAAAKGRDDSNAAFLNRRILVVDDNRDAADSLELLLKTMGAIVTTAHNGPATLKAMDSFHPSIVLLDIGMPYMDGNEVARRIRLRPDGRDVLLVALTGWGHEEARRRTEEAGFDRHMIKPVDLGALRELIASLPVEGFVQTT
jgi:signal transduction histidine kinase